MFSHKIHRIFFADICFLFSIDRSTAKKSPPEVCSVEYLFYIPYFSDFQNSTGLFSHTIVSDGSLFLFINVHRQVPTNY
jgi:hypothetical protein